MKTKQYIEIKAKMMKSGFLILAIYVLTIPCVISQDISGNNSTRQIVVTNQDSTIKANILVSTKKIKTENSRVYFWYYSNQIKKNIGEYYGNPLEGRYSVFDLEKNMITDGAFRKGLRHGTWKYWNPKGGLIKQEQWKEGRMNGNFLLYNRQGDLISEKSYMDDALHGKSNNYKKDTTIVSYYYKGRQTDSEITVITRIKFIISRFPKHQSKKGKTEELDAESESGNVKEAPYSSENLKDEMDKNDKDPKNRKDKLGTKLKNAFSRNKDDTIEPE